MAKLVTVQPRRNCSLTPNRDIVTFISMAIFLATTLPCYFDGCLDNYSFGYDFAIFFSGYILTRKSITLNLKLQT